MCKKLEQLLQTMPETDRNSAIVALARTMAHELNNIFTVVAGNLAFLDEADAAETDVADTLSDVKHAVERGIALSASLHAFSGKAPPAREKTSMRQEARLAAGNRLRLG